MALPRGSYGARKIAFRHKKTWGRVCFHSALLQVATNFFCSSIQEQKEVEKAVGLSTFEVWSIHSPHHDIWGKKRNILTSLFRLHCVRCWRNMLGAIRTFITKCILRCCSPWPSSALFGHCQHACHSTHHLFPTRTGSRLQYVGKASLAWIMGTIGLPTSGYANVVTTRSHKGIVSSLQLLFFFLLPPRGWWMIWAKKKKKTSDDVNAQMNNNNKKAYPI